MARSAAVAGSDTRFLESSLRGVLRRQTVDQRFREGILLCAVILGAVAVVGLWWLDQTNVLSSIGEDLTAAGRITGLVGTYLALVQVVLVSRLSWLDRFIGSDRLSAWHRRNGAYVIYFLVAHTLLTVWGYALADKTSVTSETGRLVLSYPDVLAATVGLLLFVVVAVLSVRRARRRLKYETWYLIHLYTYVAIALSFSHQLATGDDFVTHPVNRALWVSMYLATAIVLVAYRFVVPLRNAIRRDLRVAAVVPEGHTAVSVYVTGHGLDGIPARAGQFFRWRFIARDGWWQSHPFSLSAAPNAEYLRITAKSVGDHSESLRNLKPGTRVIAEGPYGSLTTDRRIRRKVLLIAGGVGITPLLALLEEMACEPGDLTLLYRARSERDLVLRSEIEDLARAKGADVHYLLGSRSSNPHALSAGEIHALVPDVRGRDVYLCGPGGMMDEAKKSLRALGVRRGQVHHEHFEL
jgi:predicted ferric reductase